MASLVKLFKDLQSNKKNYLSSLKGSEFEDRIRTGLDIIGYSSIYKRDIQCFNDIKKMAQQQVNPLKIINKTNFKQHYIHQPVGTQNYPDFMIFTEQCIINIEVKYSSAKRSSPVWNSGLPRLNGVYIFGSYNRQDITFFKGDAILSVCG